MPSPAEGVLVEILAQEGETVEVGTVIARIGPAGSEAAPAPAAAPEAAAEAPAPEPAVAAAAPEPAAEPSATPSPGPAPAPVPQPATAPAGNGRSFVSPVVARIAAEHGVDPSAVTGTGAGGRVTKKDILAYIESGPPAAAPQLLQPSPPLPPRPPRPLLQLRRTPPLPLPPRPPRHRRHRPKRPTCCPAKSSSR